MLPCVKFTKFFFLLSLKDLSFKITSSGNGLLLYWDFIMASQGQKPIKKFYNNLQLYFLYCR